MTEKQEKNEKKKQKDKTKKNADRTNTASFPIVGIGASAGGLEAFKEFFFRYA